MLKNTKVVKKAFFATLENLNVSSLLTDTKIPQLDIIESEYHAILIG